MERYVIARLASIWRNLWRRDRIDRDLSDELGSTIDLLAEEKIDAGMTPDEARRRARAELGSVESIKDHVRDVRAGAWIGTIRQDVRYGVRLLGKSPLFTTT